MTYRILACALVLSGLAAACQNTTNPTQEMDVQSELAPMEKPEVLPEGTVLQAKKNGDPETLEVVSVGSKRVTYERSDGCRFQRSREYGWFFSPSVSWDGCGGSSGGRDIVDRSGSPWPLEVGKSWSYKAEGWSGANKWESDETCAVDGTARVEVPMGAFDTYKVTCEGKWAKTVRYVSPKVGTTVKMVQTRAHYNSNAPEFTWALQRVKEPTASS